MQGNPPVEMGRAVALRKPEFSGLERAAEYAAASRSVSTRRTYASVWSNWTRACAERAWPELPARPEHVAIFIAELADAGRKVSTIRQHLTAIASAHRMSGHPSPTQVAAVRMTMDGIERKLGAAPLKKAALTVDLATKALKKIPDDLAGRRDRALIMVGFAAALRRSEIVGLDVADIRSHPKGLVVHLRRSKTDQRGEGKTKAIPTGRRIHVAEALDAWLAAAGIKDGPIFRGVHGPLVLPDRLSTRQVGRIVKARAAAIGLNPKSFGSHSLRSGYITSAADSGATLQTIANHAGHAKVDTTLGYVQVQDAFANHSGRKFL